MVITDQTNIRSNFNIVLDYDVSGSHAQNVTFDKDIFSNFNFLWFNQPNWCRDTTARAKAVAKLLTDSGIAAERIEMRKPQTLTAGSDGADKQARRVDIVAAQ